MPFKKELLTLIAFLALLISGCGQKSDAQKSKPDAQPEIEETLEQDDTDMETEAVDSDETDSEAESEDTGTSDSGEESESEDTEE